MAAGVIYKAARVSAPVVPHCLLSALLLPAPRVIRNCPAGPGAGRARVLVAAGPVCRRAIRTPRWWLIRWAPGQIRRICASAGCCGGGRRVGTGVGCGESAAAGRRGHGCGGSGGVWAWGAERRLALGVGSSCFSMGGFNDISLRLDQHHPVRISPDDDWGGPRAARALWRGKAVGNLRAPYQCIQ